MKYLLLVLFLSSCSTSSTCVLTDRYEEGDSLILLYTCSGQEKICRVEGNRARDCKKYLAK